MQIQVKINRATQTIPPPVPEPQPELDPAKRYFRGLHAETEGGRKPSQPGMPAVVPAENSNAVPLTREIQWMSYDLMHAFCKEADAKRWRILHGNSIAMTNKGAGYGYPDTILRDYINKKDIAALDDRGNPALPKYDKVRTFQGSIISGEVVGNFIVCTPGIDAIDARNFSYPRGNYDPLMAPSPEARMILQRIIDRKWYSIAIGTGNPPYHFRSQWGSTCWIVYPFIMDRITSFALPFFGEWHKSIAPEPLKTYLPTT